MEGETNRRKEGGREGGGGGIGTECVMMTAKYSVSTCAQSESGSI